VFCILDTFNVPSIVNVLFVVVTLTKLSDEIYEPLKYTTLLLVNDELLVPPFSIGTSPLIVPGLIPLLSIKVVVLFLIEPPAFMVIP